MTAFHLMLCISLVRPFESNKCCSSSYTPVSCRHPALIQDLLSEGQQYVLTARFQSDPIDRRFGQYHQMSGGRFLISAKDIAISEKMLKVKTFIKERLQLDTGILLTEYDRVEVAKLMDEVEIVDWTIKEHNTKPKSLQVSDSVAGYIAHKTGHSFDGYCKKKLIDDQSNRE